MNNIYQITVRIDKLSFEDLHSTFDVIKNFWLNNYVWKVILGRYSWRVLKRILSHFHYLGHIVKGKCVITSLLFMCKICSLSIQQLSRETKHEKTFVLSINNYKEYNMETRVQYWFNSKLRVNIALFLTSQTAYILYIRKK